MVFNGGVSSFAAFLLLAASLAAQTNPVLSGEKNRTGARKPSQTSSTVPRVLQVDVAVTDAGGRPTGGLTAADFDLLVDGKSKPITDFSYLNGEPLRLVLLVDDSGLSAVNADRIRRALEDLLNRMKPADEAAVLRTRSSTSYRESLTSDRKTLAEAIRAIEYEPPPAPAGKIHDEYVLAGLSSGMRRALGGLGALPGRKAVVIVSQDLATARQHPERFKDIAGLAAVGKASLYCIDIGNSSSSLELDSLLLAGDTGGLNLGPDLATSLDRVLLDQQGYYLLSYQTEMPGGFELPGAATDRIQVTVKNGAFHSRSRSTAFGAPSRADLPSRTAAETAASPYAADPIHVLLNPFFTLDRTRGQVISIQVWVDTKDLTFTHQLNGVHRALAALELSLGSTGTRTEDSSYDLTLQLNDDEYAKALRSGWTGEANLRVRGPGTYVARAIVRDATASRSGSASQLVQVPDVAAGDLLISGISMRPIESTGVDAAMVGRTFPPGANLRFGYQILNSTVESGEAAALDSRLRLFRGESEIFTGTPQTLPAIKLEDAKRRAITGEVRLGAKLPAGRYRLEVTVAEKQSAKPRQASQWVDFEVRP